MQSDITQEKDRGPTGFGERIRSLRKLRGLKMVELAGLVQVSQSAVSQWETGREFPGRENLKRLASALNTNVATLLAEGDAALANVVPEDSIASPTAMPIDVPVYGTAVGGSDGDFSFNGQIVDYVRRPPGVVRLRSVYALWVTGDSMAPWNRSGDLIFVSPAQPATPGDHVVVELHGSHEHDPGVAMVKLFQARTATQLRLRQYNPDSEFSLPLAHIKSVHKVLSLRDLLGV